jgi:hypothetical protein
MIIATMSNLPDEAHRTVHATPGFKNTHLRAAYQLLSVEPSDPELPLIARSAYPSDDKNLPHILSREDPTLCFLFEIAYTGPLPSTSSLNACSSTHPILCGAEIYCRGCQ